MTPSTLVPWIHGAPLTPSPYPAQSNVDQAPVRYAFVVHEIGLQPQ